MNFIQQLLLPQFAMGAVETIFNHLIARSPQTRPILRKLAGKSIKMTLNQRNLAFFILFNDDRTDWLSTYEGEVDCEITIETTALPKLADRTKLSDLINTKQLILNGDIQLLQHFSLLLDELEKDPAELLSHFIGDVPAHLTTQSVQHILSKIKHQFGQDSRNFIDNLMVERPVLVHRLQLIDFYDQIAELEQQALELEQKFVKLGIS